MTVDTITNPVTALTHAAEDLRDEVGDLIDLCTDPEGADLAELLADIREVADVVRTIDTEVSEALRKAMPADQVVTPTLRVERRRARDRKEWRHEDWQHDVRTSVIRQAGLLGVSVFDAQGSEVEPSRIFDVVAAAQRVHGAGQPKTTALRGIGLDPEDYCSTSPGRVTITVARLVSEDAD